MNTYDGKSNKLSKSALLALVAVFISPVAGLVLAFSRLKKNNASQMIVVISIFSFFATILIPPFQDLYRRYIENYVSYSYETTIMQAIEGHVDILFYVNSLIFRKLDVPFFLIPAIYSSISVYAILSALRDAIIAENDAGLPLERSNNRMKFFILFCFINILTIALGLRFGFAVALMVKSLSMFYFKKERSKSFIVMLVACLMHFSMIFVLLSFILSNFITIRKKYVLIFCIISAFLSKVILPFVITNLNLGGINDYVTSGYIDGTLAQANLNINAIIISVFSYTVISLFIFIHLFKTDKRSDGFTNFLNIFLISCFAIIISFTAFNRYIIGVGMFLFVIQALRVNVTKKFNWKIILITIAIVNMLFSNIYIQRRPILLANMWQGVLLPTPFLINYTMEDFRTYLKKINSDGDWIGNELSTNRGG